MVVERVHEWGISRHYAWALSLNGSVRRTDTSVIVMNTQLLVSRSGTERLYCAPAIASSGRPARSAAWAVHESAQSRSSASTTAAAALSTSATSPLAWTLHQLSMTCQPHPPPSPPTPPPPLPPLPPPPLPLLPTASTALTPAYSAKRPRTNWFASPQLAAQILAAVKLHQSFQGAVTALQRDEKTAGVFDTLNESTVRQWYHSRSFTLTPHSEHRLAGHTAPRSGRPPLLTQYPDVEQYVVDAITSIRSAGGVINSIVISAFFRGMVRAKHPELFKRFRFGRRWCRWWFGRTFDWTYKRGSTSGQKLPADWEEQCAAMVKRVSASAAEHKIKHPCFIINWDQTGCVLVPAGKYTYASVKSKQVPIVGKDEKRQITAVVASTLEGEMLPLQLIFAGQDKNKQEQKAVRTLNEVTTKRVRDWHLTQTHNHWSSLESMKDYIRVIIKKWVDNKARQHNVVLPHVILLIDCWSVHTSAAFRDWIKVAHPNYHLLFVPANCTSKAQPADAGLQRPFKNAITNSLNAWMADEIHHTVMGGTAAAEVRVDLGLKRLKPQMVHWAWVAWDRLKRSPDVVRDSWNKCGLSSVLIAEQQVDAMRFCMSNKEDEPGVEPDLELERTDSDGEDEAEDGVSDEWIEGE